MDLEAIVRKPTITLADVAGMEKLKEEIIREVVNPIKNNSIKPGYGLILYGPPGCGKTYILKAAAGECKAESISIMFSDLMNTNLKNTEANVHAIFELARKNSPCMLFFDEVNWIGGCRLDPDEREQYIKAMVTQMLYEMDGIEVHNENVLVITATNGPWDVDAALLRSGRFSKTIYVPEPDLASREAIIRYHCRKYLISNDIQFDLLAVKTEGYSSSDLKWLVLEATDYFAIQSKIQQYITEGFPKEVAQRQAEAEIKIMPITMDDFARALNKRKSSLLPYYKQARYALKKLSNDDKVLFKDLVDKIEGKE